MESINEILVNPEFQAAAVIILGIVFKAMWNAIRDQSRAIELSGGPAKHEDGLRSRKPINQQ
jgi:hypothetical protein